MRWLADSGLVVEGASEGADGTDGTTRSDNGLDPVVTRLSREASAKKDKQNARLVVSRRSFQFRVGWGLQCRFPRAYNAYAFHSAPKFVLLALHFVRDVESCTFLCILPPLRMRRARHQNALVVFDFDLQMECRASPGAGRAIRRIAKLS